MPVPAAALLVTAPVEMMSQFGRGNPDARSALVPLAVGVLALAVVLMNLYPVRYLHIGRLMSRKPMLVRSLVLLWLAMMFTPYFGVMILALCSVCVGSPLFICDIAPSVA